MSKRSTVLTKDDIDNLERQLNRIKEAQQEKVAQEMRNAKAERLRREIEKLGETPCA